MMTCPKCGTTMTETFGDVRLRYAYCLHCKFDGYGNPAYLLPETPETFKGLQYLVSKDVLEGVHADLRQLYNPAHADKYAREFARAEVSEEDPLRSTRGE